MAIIFSHKDVIEDYVADNIVEINAGISKFKKKNAPCAKFDDTDIKNYLSQKLAKELPTVKTALLNDFESLDFRKSKVEELANRYVFYKNDLMKILEVCVFSELQIDYSQNMVDAVVAAIFDSTNISEERKRFLKKSLTSIAQKSLFLLLQNGFLLNMNNIESGVMTANAGDSAQLLFVSRAILAGFNCSNVDVRSSRYDAVIDYQGKIFKVQVKGISGSTVSFKDRDRGGRGVDTQNERNQGKRITSADCDIYAAVDKQVGICYIIPMIEIDPWANEDIVSVNVSELEEYRENWGVIARLYSDGVDNG